jgi:toxin CptA
MPHWMRSSNACGPCRLDWRPSRWVIGAVLVLGVAAASSILASEMPRGAAMTVAALALWRGIQLALYEAIRPARALVWSANQPPRLDGELLQDARLTWRGPLAFLEWRNASGRIQRLAWWPDTLHAEARRELKLADADSGNAHAHASMAP